MTRPAHPWISSLCCVLASGCAGPALTWDDLEERASAPELRRYHDDFYAELGSRWVRTATHLELRERIASGCTLFIGDYHTDRGLHDAHLRLLRRLADGGLQGLLLIEALGTQDQTSIERFLGNAIDLAELRRGLADRWHNSWLDNTDVDSRFFRELLIFAKERGWPVRALEPTPRLPLARRDARMTRSLIEATEDFSDRTPIVVVGQTHLLGPSRMVDRFAEASNGQAVVLAARTNDRLAARPAELSPSDEFLISDRDVWFLRGHTQPRAANAGVRNGRRR